MDPLHEELSDFINRQQITYLTAITERIMDKEFGDFLKENFEGKMSNYAKSSEHEPRGVGYTEPHIIADDIKAALEAAVWDLLPHHRKE